MSELSTERSTVLGPWPVERVARTGALLAALALLWSYVAILWHVTTVVGGRTSLAAVGLVAFALATVTARALSTRAGLAIGGLAFAVGATGYLLSLPEPYYAVLSVGQLFDDMYVLLTGNLSIIQIVEADVWAITMAPAPVYLTWYLALDRRYELGAVVGMTALGFFVLTGDSTPMTTLVGATSALAVLGLGAVEETDATWEQVQELGLVLVATVLIARLFRFVPEQGIASGPTAGGGGGGDSTTLEASLLTDDDELTVQGSISLSPRVRFSVAARDPRYWHAGTYDRYTGEGWVRTGGTDPYDGQLSPPPGSSRSLVQDVELHSSLATVPAAWRPVAVEHETPVGLAVTDAGTLTPLAAFSEGDSYRVVSETPEWSRDLLREAGTDYPRDLASRYTQLPEGTPDRLAEHAAEVTADADNPYDAAAAVASWLITNKAYSRRITRPEGDVADAFVFRMEQGYCVYFATAMVAMLRTQGVPARFAVGYTPGELEDERWVVRGYNSHAWVDVYFPGFGWVPFDPTPSSPRQAAEQERLGQAREANATDVDPGGAEPEGTPTPTPTPTATESTASGSTANGSTPNENALDDAEIDPGGGNGEVGGLPTATPRGDDQIVAGPSDAGATVTGNATDGADGAAVGDAGGRDRLTLLASAAGIALGAYRFGLVERGFDAVRLRVQRRTDSPDRDAARAFERLELLLAREYRQRREGETPRGYLASLDDEGIDPRSRRVAEIYERAYYGHGVSRDAADEAVDLVDELVDEYGRL